MLRIAAIGIVSSLLASAALAQEAPDAKRLLGTWKPVSVTLSGNPFPEAILKQMKLVIDEGTYQVPVGQVVDKGAWKIDPTSDPKTMDLAGTDGPNKGKQIVAIYKFDGGKLVVCYNLVGDKRPAGFESKPNQAYMLATYERVPE